MEMEISMKIYVTSRTRRKHGIPSIKKFFNIKMASKVRNLQFIFNAAPNQNQENSKAIHGKIELSFSGDNWMTSGELGTWNMGFENAIKKFIYSKLNKFLGISDDFSE